MRRPARRQRGVALILMLIALLVGIGALVASGYGGGEVRLARERSDRAVLERAKRALIDRALADANNPGSLRCPDTDNDGVSQGGACAIRLARFPWATVDTPDLRDATGERLWYATSLAWLDNPGVLNSETPGELTLDGSAGLVALVIAPGAPLGGQSQRNLAPNDPAQFLEGENADGDLTFTALTGAGRNDQVIAVTVDDVMRGVHKRVLRVVRDAMEQYRTQYGVYPWAIPFADPTLSNFVAQAGVREGLVPMQVGGQPFFTDYRVTWALSGPGAQLDPGYAPPGGTLTQAELENNSANVPLGRCTVTAADVFSCDMPVTVVQVGVSAAVAVRAFTFELPVLNADAPAPPPAAPDAGNVGARRVDVGGVMPASAGAAITIQDFSALGTPLGGGSIVFDGATGGTLNVTGIDTAPALPAGHWYAANRWHRLVYMALAAGYAPGAGNACTPGVNCLVLQNGPPAINDKAALLLVAGADLGGARPSGTLGDYFEGDNASPGDDLFVFDFTAPGFNDAVLVLGP